MKCNHIFAAHSQKRSTWFVLFVHVIEKTLGSVDNSLIEICSIRYFFSSIRQYTWKFLLSTPYFASTQQFILIWKCNQNWTKKEAYTIPKISSVWKTEIEMIRVPLWRGHKSTGKKRRLKGKRLWKQNLPNQIMFIFIFSLNKIIYTERICKNVCQGRKIQIIHFRLVLCCKLFSEMRSFTVFVYF